MGAFDGSARYLQIAVRQSGGGGYDSLSPRQAISAAPYALSLVPGAVISGSIDFLSGNMLSVTNSAGPGVGLRASSDHGFGVYATSANSYGVQGTGGAVGVSGSGLGPDAIGVQAEADAPNAVGVWAQSLNGTAVRAVTTSGYAGVFDGKVKVNGTLTVTGQIFAGVKDFMIDDPLDPANKYMYHTSVESSDMMDIYNGNVTTDASGNATITMPAWFQALNRDFRYQLTIMGDQFAQARVSSKMQDNRFSIMTDKPNIEVSWQVTGIRQDPYANAHRLPVEQDKPANEKGLYLYPKEAGQPESKGIDYQQQQKMPQPPGLPAELPVSTPDR